MVCLRALQIRLCLFLIQNDHKPYLLIVIFFLETPVQFPSISKNSAALSVFISNVRRHLGQTKKLHCKKPFLLILFTQRILFLYKNVCTMNYNELFQTIRHYLPFYIGVFVSWGTVLSLFDLLCFCRQYWSWLFVLLSPAETNTEIQDLTSCRLN